MLESEYCKIIRNEPFSLPFFVHVVKSDNHSYHFCIYLLYFISRPVECTNTATKLDL